ncbi:hypothetical protein IE996_18820 [Klebsiella pneumoniae]|uniref:Uncharacterized protein n=1 Tax=Klebsiella pneumoniae TaxID=573 RepID=A0A927HJV4_KLEPN|nr:hypothetical protein [Klebsiella pneumoniae]MBD3709555.1 hypothetical protein [Klebsiella pneumoniae]MBO1997518.1 hypothetical protein [Klebsiella pneumoniae]
MHSDAADLILRSDAIFTAARNELFSGYVVIKNGAIAAMIANGEDIQTGEVKELALSNLAIA